MKSISRTLLITAVAVVIVGAALPASAYRRHHHHHNTWRMNVGPSIHVNRVVVVNGKRAAFIDFNVKPKSTKIYVDGTYRGTCDDFDGFPRKMALEPGKHRIRLVGPDGEKVSETVKLTGGTEINLNLDL